MSIGLKKCPAFAVTMAGMVALATLQVALPKRTHSQLENRPLAQFLSPTIETLAAGRWTDRLAPPLCLY